MESRNKLIIEDLAPNVRDGTLGILKLEYPIIQKRLEKKPNNAILSQEILFIGVPGEAATD